MLKLFFLAALATAMLPPAYLYWAMFGLLGIVVIRAGHSSPPRLNI